MFELVDLGYLNSQKHPNLDLFIFNYSKHCQFEKYWTPVTLASRGLVLNSKSELIARCLPKFFNVQEMDPNDIPKTGFTVYEKLDGSYLQIFRYDGELQFSSRGSFTSDQAIKGREIFYKKYAHLEPVIKAGYNFVFEIIYPTNRIVVDYQGLEDIILLTIINNATKEDRLIDVGFPMVKTYDFKDFDSVMAAHADNAEGFVICFNVISNIDPLRGKSKFADYVRLHRVMTNCSNRDIWNMLKVHDPLDDILEKVPDEFYDWVQSTIDKLRADYKRVEDLCLETYKPIKTLQLLRSFPGVDPDEILSKKKAAEYILKRKHRGVVFNMYYGMSYEQLIWDIVEPKWEKPFNVKYNTLNEEA